MLGKGVVVEAVLYKVPRCEREYLGMMNDEKEKMGSEQKEKRVKMKKYRMKRRRRGLNSL